MNVKLLIDGIVRQTTVLIAQLSTAAGSRAPLSRVTDEVFLSLAREIEAQGVRRQVVADMFGLALRSYQKKMQRLTESSSQPDRTLWEAVFDYVRDNHPSRQKILQRFAADGEKEVIAVLNDLVRSGLVFTTGGGRGAVYGPTQDELRQALQREHDQESIENWLWLLVFRSEVTTVDEARAAVAAPADVVDAALDELLASGRLSLEGGRLQSSNLLVPIGTEQGWEAAVLDHFRTVALAIAKKASSLQTATTDRDELGGSTFTYTVGPGHPYDREVRALLKTTRRQARLLWEKVAKFNQEEPAPSHARQRVSFYVGQLVEDLDAEDEGANGQDVSDDG